MAQELSEKIRAAAQSKGIDPELALSIARAESALNPAAKAKTSSAAGLFQVVDDTWKQYGGKPGKKLDADENIRVGTDIIADNAKYLQTVLGRAPKPAEVYAAHYFGPAKAKAVLAASPDTPIADILSAKAIKANPNLQGKTAGQVIAQLEGKVGGAPAPAAAAVPRETKTEAEKVMEPALRSGMTAKAPPQPSVPRETQLASLGPSYQAALALSFLADSDDDKREKDIDSEPSVAEKWLAQQPSRPAALDLAEVKIRSPFPTEQPQPPVMMSEGGDPVEEQALTPAREPVSFFKNASRMQDMGADVQGAMAGARIPLGEDSGLTLGANISKMTKDEKETMARAMLASLYSKVGEGELRANLIKPQGSGTEGVYMGDVGGSYPVGEGRLSASRTYMHTPYGSGPTGYQVGYGGKVGPGFLSANAMLPDRGSPQFQIRYQLPVGRAEGSPETGEVKEPNILSVPTYSRTVSYEMYPGQEGQFDQRDAARHMLAAGTVARKYGPTAAEMLGKLHEITTSPGDWVMSKLGMGQMPVDYEQDLHNNRLGIELARRSKSQKDLEDLVQQMAEKAQGQQTPGAAWIGKPVRPVKRADGSPEGGEQADLTRPATFNPNIARQGAAARRLAAMRDVNTLPDPRTYAAVSGFLGQAPDEQGFSALHPDIQGIKKAGEAGFYAGTATQVAPVVGSAAKMLGKLTGSALNERLLAGQSLIPGTNTPAPIAFAVKPRGGTVLYTQGAENAPLPVSKLDNLIMEYRFTAARDLSASDELVDFIKQKAPKYFTTTYGTADDPLRTAIRERAIEPFGRDLKKIPPYLVDAAKFPQARGHLQAKHELERMYDELTGVDPMILKPETGGPSMTEVRRSINQKMAQEGVPVEAQNAPSVTGYSQSEFAEYPYGTKMLNALVQNEGQLPPNIQHALRNAEPMYDISPGFDLLDPRSVVDALKQIPADKLKRMSFPEALIQGTQALAPIRDYRTAIDMADRGAKIPPAVLQQFTKPVAPVRGGEWVQITDPVATELEGKLMKHSVGGYSAGDSYGTGYTGLPYGGKQAFDDGLVRVFSLRDKAGEPTITVEMARPRGQEGWNVTQVRGRFNSEPMDKESVFGLFDKIEQSEGIKNIKPNSYTRSYTGADTEGTLVDWGKEYDLWKQGTSE